MRKRKLRIKKLWIFFFSVVLIVSIYFFLSQKEEPLKVYKVNYISEILSYNREDLEKDFLIWVEKEYGTEVLKKINETLKENSYTKQIWHNLTGNSYIVLNDMYSNNYKDRSDVTVIPEKKESITIGYAGDVSLADNWSIMPKYKSRKKKVYGILSENIVNQMEAMDWMIVNSEFAFSKKGTPMKNKLYTFRADPENVNIYNEMSVDMVTLANNHVYDYGKDAFLDTLSTLKNQKLPYIGAGKNSKEAESAHYLIINGYKIAFLSATRAEKYIMTPEAKESSPGVFRCYDPTRLSERIKEEKKNSDYVVAIVHWGTENSHKLETVQKETGRLYIDSGADMVIGHHAHVLQGFEYYKGKLIAYNLGNFIFNTLKVDTGILKWTLNKDGSSQFHFVPGLQKDCYTDILSSKAAKTLYNKLSDWSVNVLVDENGTLKENGK